MLEKAGGRETSPSRNYPSPPCRVDLDISYFYGIRIRGIIFSRTKNHERDEDIHRNEGTKETSPYSLFHTFLPLLSGHVYTDYKEGGIKIYGLVCYMLHKIFNKLLNQKSILQPPPPKKKSGCLHTFLYTL